MKDYQIMRIFVKFFLIPIFVHRCRHTVKEKYEKQSLNHKINSVQSQQEYYKICYTN